MNFEQKKSPFKGDFLVRPRRLELPRIAPQAPQACVSTNSTMAAIRVIVPDFYKIVKDYFLLQ